MYVNKLTPELDCSVELVSKIGKRNILITLKNIAFLRNAKAKR